MARRRRSRSVSISRGSYRSTPARKAALRKAQLASAQKRRGHHRAKVGIAATVGIATIAGLGVARHKYSGSSLKATSHHSLRNGEPEQVRMVAPYSFDVHGFRTGGGATISHKRVTTRAGANVSRQGNTFNLTARPLRGGKALRVSYTHVSLRQAVAGKKTSSIVETSKKREPIDRDSIPFYKESSSRSFPHLSEIASRRQNKGLRKAGMLQ